MIPISVILPVYNASAYLQYAIESILNQDFQHFELILINDGSTDESEKIIQSFNDARIVYLKNDQNLGLISTLNKGLQLAKGKYIARMDADDIALQNRFRLQFEYMEKNPETDVCGCSISYFNHTGLLRSWIVPVEDKEIKTELLAGPAFAHPSVFIRADSLRKHHLFYSKDYLHTEDYELWIRMASLGFQFHNIPDILLHYRLHAANVSISGASIQKSTHRRLQVLQLEKYLKRNLSEVEKIIVMSDSRSLKIRVYSGATKKLYREILNLNKTKCYYDVSRLSRVLDYLLLSKLNFSQISISDRFLSLMPPLVGNKYILLNILKG